MEYTLIETDFSTYVERINDDGTSTAIPLDPANSDYQAYLEHEAAAK
jgi:hypothetical protein